MSVTGSGSSPAGESGQGQSRRGFLRVVGATGALAAAGYGVGRASGAEAARPPNVVLVLVDDLGWPEFGCYGDTFNETPNVDALAGQGLRFTDAYASAPVCSPDRASIMTGQYPARVGITDYLRPSGDDFLGGDPATLPGLLSAAGYTTGMVGKWHLTETYHGPYQSRPGNPHAHGWDSVAASEREYIAAGDYFAPYFFLPHVDAPEGEYLTDRLNREAVDFIDAYADQPFFLYLSHYAVHAKLAGKPDKVAKYRDKPGAGEEGKNPVLAAMLESVDEGVGMITKTLADRGLAEDTVVIVMSDNGGDGRFSSSAPLRGSKTLLYEGGIRVPLIVRWPGVVEPATSRTPVNSVDLLPTLLDITGAGPPERTPVDGVSLTGLLRNGSEPRRDALYWVYPHRRDILGAVRQGRHKLLQFVPDGHVELYDLIDDIGETEDLSAAMPDKTAELRDKLAAHIADTGLLPAAPTPSAYPRADVTDDFSGDLADYTVLSPESENRTGDVAVTDGRLTLSATRPSFALLRSNITPQPGSDIAVAVRLHSFAGEGTNREDSLFAGLVRDEQNYALVWHNRRKGQTGWDVRQGGQRTGGRVAALDELVQLASGSWFAFVTHGESINAFADTGDGWNFLFTVDISEHVRLGDPETLRHYRYALGLRADAGTIAVEGFRGARAP